MHPELEFEEENTAHLVCEILDEFGIKYQKNIAKTGILVIVEGKKKSQKKTKMCSFKRADMDAFPMQEKTNLSYGSKIDGRMHACGHDGHTAGLLGAALILNDLKD